MTNQAKMRSIALATKGDMKLLVAATSLLLTTPAPVATRPLINVALPMMVERSVEGSPAELDAEMSHDSKAEKRMEVDAPPSTLPKRSKGTEGMVMQAHVSAYVTQNTRHSLRRPLRMVQNSKVIAFFIYSCCQRTVGPPIHRPKELLVLQK